MKDRILLMLAIILWGGCQLKTIKNGGGTDAEIAEKVAHLLSQMTLEEKIAEMTQDAPANERLGIPFMKFGEDLHGLWYDGVTVYPQAIACASTWDPELIRTMAAQTALEARALNITHVYSPNLDVISGDARYGRVEESYGKTPTWYREWALLSSRVCRVWDLSSSTKTMSWQRQNTSSGTRKTAGAFHLSVLKDTLEKDPSLIEYIDRATTRILSAKYKLGLFGSNIREAKTDTIVSRKEHQNSAYEMARKAIILLKNDNDLLPLDPSKIRSLAVIGPNAVEEKPATGTYALLGGYSGLPPYYVSVLEGLTKKANGKIEINYAPGCDLLNASKAGFPQAVAAATRSDAVVLVVGGSRKTCGEGVDQSDLDLSGVQNELVEAIHRTGKPIIVVLINGRPLTINYIAENIPSILETWYLGMHSGDAIADAIFGNVNPGGKLTVSFPRSAAQIPVTYLERPDFIGTGKGQYQDTDKSPVFPFGYGLSYTTFSYGAPQLRSATVKAGASTMVSVEVTNTGRRAGDKVVQMYVRDDYASVGRYLKMLKGFKRISLQPGETKTVEFDLNFDNLFVYDQDMNKVVEPGTFTISVGASSREEDLKKITLTIIE